MGESEITIEQWVERYLIEHANVEVISAILDETKDAFIEYVVAVLSEIHPEMGMYVYSVNQTAYLVYTKFIWTYKINQFN
jgi:hypothetical protein